MNKKYIALSDDGKHDYDLTVITTDKGVEYSIYHSQAEHWRSHVQGQLILKMTDTGNGMVFDRKLGKKMDYCELLTLHMILSIERCLDPQLKYQIIENKTLIEI